MSQQLQQKAGPWPTYRPIAPSVAPPKIAPRPDDTEKRRWSSTFEDSPTDLASTNKLQRKLYSDFYCRYISSIVEKKNTQY
jgi:5-methylcytosine-specific restriction endonuclease McrA